MTVTSIRWLSMNILALALMAGIAQAEDGDETDTVSEKVLPLLEVRPAELERTRPFHRNAFWVGGFFLMTGAGLGWAAQSDAQVAAADPNASSARLAAEAAQQSAAAANVSYALAGAALGYGLVMELLPDDIADKAQLRFEF